ncbi:hypothetical protein MMC30_004771 [Trapelia coarctata]|nr:hypothetical protein [Trapelia coarctata]
MNSIRQIQQLNKRELENGVPPSASWHADYRDTAYIYIGGLPYTLTEGDIITIFSQYGEPVACHLQRDKDTGKSKGFCWLKYEDQRSTELAVDNLGGATVLGRVLRVDHARYKPGEGDAGAGEKMDMDGAKNGQGNGRDEEKGAKSESEEEREMLQEEIELAKLIRDHDEEDPMKEFLVQEKKEEVKLALERVKVGGMEKKERRHKHRHRHSEDSERHGEDRGGRDRDSKREKNDDRDRNESPRSRRRPEDADYHRSRRHEDQDRDRDDAYHLRRKRRDDY